MQVKLGVVDLYESDFLVDGELELFDLLFLLDEDEPDPMAKIKKKLMITKMGIIN